MHVVLSSPMPRSRLPLPRARPYLERQLRWIEGMGRAEAVPLHVRYGRCIGFQPLPTVEELIPQGTVRMLLAWRFGNLVRVPGMWPDVWRVAVEVGVEVGLMGEGTAIPGRTIMIAAAFQSERRRTPTRRGGAYSCLAQSTTFPS